MRSDDVKRVRLMSIGRGDAAESVSSFSDFLKWKISLTVYEYWSDIS